MATPELKGPVPTPGKYVRISLLVKKKEGVTDEFFHAYWANNHGQQALQVKKFVEKCRRYNLFHVTPEFREKAKVIGAPIAEYDGIAELWVDSMEDWQEVISDPEFIAFATGDNPKYVHLPFEVLVGYDHTIFGNEIFTK